MLYSFAPKAPWECASLLLIVRLFQHDPIYGASSFGSVVRLAFARSAELPQAPWERRRLARLAGSALEKGTAHKAVLRASRAGLESRRHVKTDCPIEPRAGFLWERDSSPARAKRALVHSYRILSNSPLHVA